MLVSALVSVCSRWSPALLWWSWQERWWATVEPVLDSGVMRCEKVLVLVTFLGNRGCRRCWPFAAVVGRLPPVVVRLWVSNKDNHGVWVVAAGGRRRSKSCVFFIYSFRVCLCFYFLHHHSSFTHPLFFY